MQNESLIIIWRVTDMRIKATKFIWGDVADISISRFNCSEDNLLSIIRLFEYKAVIIEIGAVEKSSSLFQIIKKLSINYITSLYDDSSDTDVVFIMDGCNLEELIHYILASECDSFFIAGVEDRIMWQQYLHNRFNNRQLIKNKVINLSIVFLLSESQIDISFRKDMYNIKQVILKIKNQNYSD